MKGDWFKFTYDFGAGHQSRSEHYIFVPEWQQVDEEMRDLMDHHAHHYWGQWVCNTNILEGLPEKVILEKLENVEENLKNLTETLTLLNNTRVLDYEPS